MSTYSIDQVAGFVIARCKKNGRKPTIPELHPLLYFVQAQFIQEKNEPCFDSPIYASPHGPQIDDLDLYIEEQPPRNKLEELFPIIIRMEPKDLRILNHAIDPACSVSEKELNQTIMEQAPFRAAMVSESKEILDENIRKFYRR